MTAVARRLPQTRYAQSMGAKIAYQVSGAGQPDLVMVPGLVSHLDLQWRQTAYRRFIGALERRCRVVRFDKRGTGLSDPADDPPTIDERVADMAAVMDAANSSPAVLFGVSDGGRAAIAFAAAHSERVVGLILYGTSYRGPRSALFRRYRSIVRHWGEGRLFDLVAPTAASSQAREDVAAFERAAASPAMAAALVESLGPVDVHQQMSVVAVPTLVLHREHDMIPLEDARRLAGQIPGATLRILPGQDHVPWVGDWQPVVEEILGFVGELGPPKPEPGKRGRLSRPWRPSMGWPSLTEAERPVAGASRPGAQQLPDRRPSVPVPLHGRDPPQACLRQVGRGVSNRARCPRRPGWRPRGEYLISGMPDGLGPGHAGTCGALNVRRLQERA